MDNLLPNAKVMIHRFAVPSEMRNDGWGLRPQFKPDPEIEAA